MKITLGNTLPPYPAFIEGIRRAPDRSYTLTPAQTATALKNALRYIPLELHEQLAPEFMEELRTRGRIYGYRFRPAGDLKARAIDEYRGKCVEGKAFQVMIDNNLCFDIALYPYELVTYGETGQVCQNWMQYLLIKQYLEELTPEQTLVIESGHPLGLFRSRPDASPRYYYQLYDDRPVRQSARLAHCRTNGSCQLWADDGGRLDVYWSAGYCSWHFQYITQCRTIETRHSAG